MKLLRTLRLDPSDTFVFDAAAEPGEWAVPGSFVFMDADPAALQGKARVAFRSGFLGLGSFGWSTLAQIVDASAEQRREATEMLAHRLVTHFGAPDLAAAMPAAAEEIGFAAALCDQPTGTVIALHRTNEKGQIRETFRTLRPAEGQRPARAFAFLEVAEDEEPAETVDLAALAQTGREPP